MKDASRERDLAELQDHVERWDKGKEQAERWERQTYAAYDTKSLAVMDPDARMT
jgi:hypothetical protein